jgi:hypothetical protein
VLTRDCGRRRALGATIMAFHPYSTVEVQFVPILMSVTGEKVFVTGEKHKASDHWGYWGELRLGGESAAGDGGAAPTIRDASI